MMRDAEKRRDDAERDAVIAGIGVIVLLVGAVFYSPLGDLAAVVYLCLIFTLQRDLMRACRTFKIHDDLIAWAANLRRFARDPRLSGPIGEGLKELLNVLGAA